ncbi:MAG: hypothetical protein AB1671_12075 [Thermodesulfobacteriota bacterium]|jgi:hypothetical protein
MPRGGQAPLSLDDFQREILGREVHAFIQGWTDATARARYTALLQEVESGGVTAEGSETLGGLLEIVLESGRARKLYGPAGENSLLSLFHKTPLGGALQQHANAVNRALKGLEGQVLTGVTFRPSGPGAWVLTLQTDRCELAVRIDRKGIQVDTLGVDLG